MLYHVVLLIGVVSAFEDLGSIARSSGFGSDEQAAVRRG